MALVLGAGFPPVYGGPLAYGRSKGLSHIKKRLEFWHKIHGNRFFVAEKLKKEVKTL